MRNVQEEKLFRYFDIFETFQIHANFVRVSRLHRIIMRSLCAFGSMGIRLKNLQYSCSHYRTWISIEKFLISKRMSASSYHPYD